MWYMPTSLTENIHTNKNKSWLLNQKQIRSGGGERKGGREDGKEGGREHKQPRTRQVFPSAFTTPPLAITIAIRTEEHYSDLFPQGWP